MHIAFFVNLAFFKDIFDMPRNDGLISFKKLDHLTLVQPNCVLFKRNGKRHGFVFAFKNHKFLLRHIVI